MYEDFFPPRNRSFESLSAEMKRDMKKVCCASSDASCLHTRSKMRMSF